MDPTRSDDLTKALTTSTSRRQPSKPSPQRLLGVFWVWLASALPSVRPSVDKLVTNATMITSAALASVRTALAPPVSLKVLLVASAALPFHTAEVEHRQRLGQFDHIIEGSLASR